MRNLIYISILTICILSGLSVIALYYSQPFNENFVFPASIEYSSIDFQSSPDYNQIEVLNSANAVIGRLDLDNSGMFPKLYSLPRLVGCLILSDNVASTSALRNSRYFNVNYVISNSIYSGTQDYNIPSNTKKTLILKAQYSSYNQIPLSEYSADNIKGITIYKIPLKESNPLATDYYNAYQGMECDSLKSTTPLATIKIG